MTEWKSKYEENAFKMLSSINSIASRIGLKDSSEGFSIVMKRRMDNGVWDWDILEDSVNIMYLEFQQLHPSFKQGFEVFHDIMERLRLMLKKKGRRIDLKYRWDENELRVLETGLGQITPVINRIKDPDAIIFLLCYSHVLRYEVRAIRFRGALDKWMQECAIEKKVRTRRVEDFFTISSCGIDGRSDMTHLRNAFAHGHFEILPDFNIHIWDRDDSEKINFEQTIHLITLTELCNLFEIKLAFVEIYIDLIYLNALLERDFKDEWRQREEHEYYKPYSWALSK